MKADHPVTFIFRLRQSGGPYIPACRQSGQNQARCWYERPTNMRGSFRRSTVTAI